MNREELSLFLIIVGVFGTYVSSTMNEIPESQYNYFMIMDDLGNSIVEELKMSYDFSTNKGTISFSIIPVDLKGNIIRIRTPQSVYLNKTVFKQNKEELSFNLASVVDFIGKVWTFDNFSKLLNQSITKVFIQFSGNLVPNGVYRLYSTGNVIYWEITMKLGKYRCLNNCITYITQGNFLISSAEGTQKVLVFKDETESRGTHFVITTYDSKTKFLKNVILSISTGFIVSGIVSWVENLVRKKQK